MFRLARSFITSLFNPFLPEEKNVTISSRHPFMLAAASGNLPEISKYSLYKDFDPNVRDETGNPPVVYAASNNRVSVLRMLMNHGANLNQTGEIGVTALIVGAYEGHLEAVSFLLQQGVDLEAAVDGNTALMWAVANNQAETVALLVRAGANVHAVNAQGGSALHIAAEQGNAEITATLLQAGADPLVAAMNGVTPVNVAEELGHQAVLDVMAAEENVHLIQEQEEDALQPMEIDAAPVTEEQSVATTESEEEGELPDYYLDAVNMEPFVAPITLPNGQTYSRSTLQALFDRDNGAGVVRCPRTRDIITRDVLNIQPSYVIQEAMQADRERLQQERKRQREAVQELPADSADRQVRQRRLQHFGRLFAEARVQPQVDEINAVDRPGPR